MGYVGFGPGSLVMGYEWVHSIQKKGLYQIWKAKSFSIGLRRQAATIRE